MPRTQDRRPEMTMTSYVFSLDVIDVEAPCTASWDAMEGDDRSRLCRTCRQQVYNLSALTTEAAAELVLRKEGRLCVRFYRRADGTVITQDCLPRRQAARRRLLAFAG